MAARYFTHRFRKYYSPSSDRMQILNFARNISTLPSRRGLGFESLSSFWKFSATVRSRSVWIGGGRQSFQGENQLRGLSTSTKARRKTAGRKLAIGEPLVEKHLQLEVQIGIEEEIPEDNEEVSNIAEILRVDVPKAMRMALDRLKTSTSRTRDRSVDNLSAFDMAELSILLCNDKFIQQLNNEWRDKDAVTDVLSMSQHISGLDIPVLMLGDIVISVDTAARQAEERGQTLIDEIRILMVHGLLHLLGYDHELSEEAEKEMEKEEECILSGLGWKGKGLIHSTYKSFYEDSSLTSITEEERKS